MSEFRNRLRWYNVSYWLDASSEKTNHVVPGDRLLGRVESFGPGYEAIVIASRPQNHSLGEFSTKEEAEAAIEAYWTTERLMKLRMLE